MDSAKRLREAYEPSPYGGSYDMAYKQPRPNEVPAQMYGNMNMQYGSYQAQGYGGQQAMQPAMQQQAMQQQAVQQQPVQQQPVQQQPMQQQAMQQQAMQQQAMQQQAMQQQAMQPQGMQAQAPMQQGAGMEQPHGANASSLAAALATLSQSQLSNLAGLLGTGPVAMGGQGMGGQQQPMGQQAMGSQAQPYMGSQPQPSMAAGGQPMGMGVGPQQQQGMPGMQQQPQQQPGMQQPGGGMHMLQQQQQPMPMAGGPVPQPSPMQPMQTQPPAGLPGVQQQGGMGMVGGAGAGGVGGMVNGGAGAPQAAVLPPLPADATATLYLDCLPPDVTRREMAHIFRPFAGYKSLRLVVKDSRSNDKNIKVFVDFVDARAATDALKALNGYRLDLDTDQSTVLRPVYARPPKDPYKVNRGAGAPAGAGAVLDPPPPGQAHARGDPARNIPNRMGPMVGPGGGGGGPSNAGPMRMHGGPGGAASAPNMYLDGGYDEGFVGGGGPGSGPNMGGRPGGPAPGVAPHMYEGVGPYLGPGPMQGGLPVQPDARGPPPHAAMHEPMGPMGPGPGGLMRMRGPGPEFGGHG
ncbi:hypothetical protein Agub_g2, partial [Astrephomene gubernaculifera]